jgi:hypothetical protein
MARVVREVREEPTTTTTHTTVTENAAEPRAERIVYFLGGVVMALIGLRIILSLLGANQANAFASLIYNLSYPFVAPFFGLFNYHMQYGVSRFEFESLIALIVWGIITLAIAKLINISIDRTPRTYS